MSNKNDGLPDPTLDDLSTLMDSYRHLKSEMDSVKNLLESAKKLLKQREEELSKIDYQFQNLVNKISSTLKKIH